MPYVKQLAAAPDGAAYVLCTPDAQTYEATLVYRAIGNEASEIGRFDQEITSIVMLGAALAAVDRSCAVHLFDGSQWTRREVARERLRINRLVAGADRLYGLAGEGEVFTLRPGGAWESLTDPDDDAYLWHLAEVGTELLAVGSLKGPLLATVRNRKLERHTLMSLERTVSPKPGASVQIQGDLTSIVALDEDRWLATGQRGVALLGDRTSLRELESGRSSNLLAARWNDRVLVAAGSEILELRGDQLEVAWVTEAATVAGAGPTLWKQANGALARLDASEWRPVTLS